MVPTTHLIVHGCYHKVMTQFFARSLRQVGRVMGLEFFMGRQCDLPATAGIYLDPHSLICIDDLPPFKATHIVRDPRDMLVSGYFYHLECTEKWCTTKDRTGTSYQERLRSLDTEEGLLYELSHSFGHNAQLMSRWPFGHRDVLELRYEEIFSDREKYWPREIFRHYGFSGRELERCIRIMDGHGHNGWKGRGTAYHEKSHFRVGTPGDWTNHFTPRVARRFKKKAGRLTIDLGYEKSLDW